MTTKFTPGPWLMCESATHVTVTNAHGDAVFHDDKRISGVMADARLIAAAPTMYEYIASSASNGCAEARKIMEAINAGR